MSLAYVFVPLSVRDQSESGSFSRNLTISQLPESNSIILFEFMELLEKVANANVADLSKDEQCPFCYERPIGHATDKPDLVDDKVTSIPSNLGCDASSWRDSKAEKKRTTGNLPYTLARHHLISAMQCYARIRRLVRMGNLIGYDINNKENGIGLPTTHWQLKYPEDGERKQYGELDEPKGKEKVAFALMKELGAQWHVGHHAFTIKVPKIDHDTWEKGGADEKNEDDYPHETQYDLLIIARLFNLVKSYPLNFCEEPERDEQFKENMNNISREIKTHLEKFNDKGGGKPADSSPFFVSMRAYEYSGIADCLPNADLPGNDVSW